MSGGGGGGLHVQKNDVKGFFARKKRSGSISLRPAVSILIVILIPLVEGNVFSSHVFELWNREKNQDRNEEGKARRSSQKKIRIYFPSMLCQYTIIKMAYTYISWESVISAGCDGGFDFIWFIFRHSVSKSCRIVRGFGPFVKALPDSFLWS